jgi:hypothetical protein
MHRPTDRRIEGGELNRRYAALRTYLTSGAIEAAAVNF